MSGVGRIDAVRLAAQGLRHCADRTDIADPTGLPQLVQWVLQYTKRYTEKVAELRSAPHQITGTAHASGAWCWHFSQCRALSAPLR